MNDECTVLRMFSDPAGECRFGAYAVALSLKDAAPPAAPFYVSAAMPATSYAFFRLPVGWFGDLHPTPNPRLVICLAGSLRFTGAEGESRTLGAGGHLMDVNTSGRGHTTEVLSNVPAEVVIVRLD